MPKFQSARSKARSLSLKSSGNHSRMSSQRWTQEEHDRLEHAICKLKLKPWSAVAAFTGGRTKRQCMSHHQKCVQMIKDVNASSRWTPAECNLLQQARGDFKMGWKMVAVHVGTRDDTQCRSHYQKCNGTTSVLHRLVISDEFREWILQSAPETGGQGFTDAEADDGRGTVSRKVADSESASNNNDFCLPDPVYTESLRPVAHEAMIIDGIHPLYDEARPSLNTPGGSADVSNHPVEENFDTTMAAVSELLFGMALAQVDHQVMLDASVHGLQDTIDGIAMVDLLMEEPERLVPLDTISHHSDFVVPDYFGYPGCFTEPSGHEQSFQSPHPIYICDV